MGRRGNFAAVIDMDSTTPRRIANRRCAVNGLASVAIATLTACFLPHAALAQPASGGPVEKVETTFESVDSTVSAQWEFPATTPAPLVVMLPASEAVDRDGLPPGYGEDPSTGIYAQLARRLLDAGFAVFRYDSPGTGRSSPGQFCTDRSTALEGYGRALDHPKVDRSRVFLLGHSASTDTIAGIWDRYAAVRKPAGAVLLANIVGEADAVHITAPVLIAVSDKTPNEVFQRGQFPADARSRAKPPLETQLVTVPGVDETLLVPQGNEEKPKVWSIDARAVDATIEWLKAHAAAGAPASR